MASTIIQLAPIYSNGFSLSPRLTYRVNYGKPQSLRVSSDYSRFEVRELCSRAPGTDINLLNGLIAGLNKPTSGSLSQQYGNDGVPNQAPAHYSQKNLVLYFVADTVLEEILFGWPRQQVSLQLRELLASRLQKAVQSVGLTGIPLDKDPNSLSGGYKRRLAMAVQLVQTPDLLILDEPLAGLDWKARADIVKLLNKLKKELTLLVVSHDLKELASLVDQSWRMEMGGVLKNEQLPI
ncbi:hypothetical protein Leryth_004199 [Lithospermum erythrorhizon]|nr:hypothetical protein Leryth_004199 [Lithospermum erythrorhizon]